MKAGIPGTQRRRTSRTAPTKSSSTANGNNPPPPPPPAPKPNVHQEFTKELTLILMGKRSEPSELYCPLSELDHGQHRAICIIDDSTTRELFSFSQKLAQQFLHVPVAKNAAEMAKMKHAEAVLKRQIETVREVMYQYMCALHPELADLDQQIELLDGWIVAAVTTQADHEEETITRLAKTLSLPRGLVAFHFVRKARERPSEES